MEAQFTYVTAVMEENGMAHPCGTVLRVCNAKSGKTINVVVVESGKLKVGNSERILDLSDKSYYALGFTRRDGIGNVCVNVVR